MKKITDFENKIPFTKPTQSGEEIEILNKCFVENKLQSGGNYTKSSNLLISNVTKAPFCSLVNSCTAALETAFLALELSPGDEVIMPSFTFPSTANAVALRGAVPVFVDIDPETMNIDPATLEQAISRKTKAIVVVHYAGVAANMDEICLISEHYNLPVIEDAAQAFGSTFKSKHLGTLGLAGAFSFHYTKNLSCGEGGSLITANEEFNEKASIIIEKGTNRKAFLNNQTAKYQWLNLGSSYVLNELSAAILSSQLLNWHELNKVRLRSWQYYSDTLSTVSPKKIRLPKLPEDATHNGHIFYFHVTSPLVRKELLHNFNQQGIQATSHFEPLHESHAGKKYGRHGSDLKHTSLASKTLVRLPLWTGMERATQDRVIEAIFRFAKA